MFPLGSEFVQDPKFQDRRHRDAHFALDDSASSPEDNGESASLLSEGQIAQSMGSASRSWAARLSRGPSSTVLAAEKRRKGPGSAIVLSKRRRQPSRLPNLMCQ
jgi:hypothetical protein